MSQVLDQPEAAHESAEPDAPQGSENVTHSPSGMAPADLQQSFDYRPVPVLAPTAAVLAGCSLAAWWLMPAVGIALIGTVVGFVAYRKIATSDGELGGLGMATASLALSGVLFVGSTAKHAYVWATEVPEGYRKVNFAHDISVHGIGMERGRIALAPQVQELVDQPIFVKGYMFPVERKFGLESFVLVKDNQLCCFGKQVEPTDMILVVLPEGRTMDYTTGMVSVGGELKIEPTSVDDQQNQVVYRMVGDICERSKTIF